MKTLLLFFVLAISVQPSYSQAHDTQHMCRIQFEVLNAGFKTTGTIGAAIAVNTFNPAEPEKSIVVIVADPSTIQTGIVIRDKHLQRSDYFHTERYPSITLKSQSLRKIARNKYSGKFQLSIKGKTQEIEIPFAMHQRKGKNSFEGTFMIDRTTFGIGDTSLTLANEVRITFNVFEE